MNVMKFGGAVLRSPEGFRQMVGILQKLDKPAVVVISAFSTSTRDLEFSARLAKKGMLAEATEKVSHIIDDHAELVRQLLADPSVNSAMNALLVEVKGALLDLMKGVEITGQLTARTLDQILSYGETLALHVARHFLAANKLDVGWIDARNVVVTSAQHGAAVPDPEKTRVHIDRNLRPLTAKHRIVLIQGFVGAKEDGVVTTMGKESSNLTATLLASLLQADSVTIWTDVEGVRSGDPRVCSNTYVRSEISYADATLAAHNGVKILYPTMIGPAERAGIPILIRSASKPDGEFTEIKQTSASAGPIVSVQSISKDAVAVNVLFTSVAKWFATTSRAIESTNQKVISASADDTSHVCQTVCMKDSAESFAALIHKLMFES